MLLQVKNLNISYSTELGLLKSKEIPIVRNVSFDIQEGEICGLVGASGCGKTTTSRCIAGLIPKKSGEIKFMGQDISGVTAGIQMIFQDPFLSLNPRLNIFDNISEPLRYLKLKYTSRQKKDKVSELMHQVGLSPDHIQRYPHEFSGGQLQRVGIARALAPSPKIIICDEAVSALDISIQAQILNLLRKLQKELQLSLLFVTHDLAVVRYISNRCMVMHEGSVVESGDTESIIQHPQHKITQELIACVPSIL